MAINASLSLAFQNLITLPSSLACPDFSSSTQHATTLSISTNLRILQREIWPHETNILPEHIRSYQLSMAIFTQFVKCANPAINHTTVIS